MDSTAATFSATTVSAADTHVMLVYEVPANGEGDLRRSELPLGS